MRPRALWLGTSLLGLLPFVLRAAPVDVPMYGHFEHTVQVGKPFADPLADVNGEVEFESPSGKKIRARAFWNGGKSWRVRFSPEERGVWKYTWMFFAPGFPSNRGTFNTVAASGDLRGAPRLSADRYSFVDATGRPWFFLADTAWNGALLSTRDEWHTYLDTRARQRFTAVQFVMTQWRAGRQDENGRAAFAVEAGRVTVNPDFFARMDEKVAAVNRAGLTAVPVLLWALTSKDKESPGESLSNEQAIRLAQYMVARYNAYNVIWILGGDGDYRNDKATRWMEIGRNVFRPDRPELQHRMATLHPRGMQSPWPGLKDEAWVSFFMYQSGHGDSVRKWKWQVTEGAVKDWTLTPPHPVIDGEINYEGHISYEGKKVIEAAAVRRAAYYALLSAPVSGVTYGAHGIWFWSRKAEVPLDHNNSGVALPWNECLEYPGGQQMKILRDVFDKMEWWKLRPERSILRDMAVDEGFTNFVPAARATDHSFALLYTPVNQELKLNLGEWAGFQGVWLNPRSGAANSVKLAESMQPPGDGDWLLWVRRQP